jgi:hypothetical protein
MKPPRVIEAVLLLAILTAARASAGHLRVLFDLLGGMAGAWAALQFAPDDRPRRGWWLVAWTHWFLGLAHLWVALAPEGSRVAGARALIVAANLCWPAALLVFARALDAGLAALETSRGRALTWILGLPALALAAWVGWLGIDEKLITTAPSVDLAWMAVSDAFIMLADAVVFTATVRLLTIAAPVLDGAIVRTYLLLCLSAALSLGAEVFTVLQPHPELAALGQITRWLGAAAWATLTGAALVQAWILCALRRSAPRRSAIRTRSRRS